MINLEAFKGHTPGPWEAGDETSVAVTAPSASDGKVIVVAEEVWRPPNRRLIAAAPDLLAEIARLTAERDALRVLLIKASAYVDATLDDHPPGRERERARTLLKNIDDFLAGKEPA